MAESPDRAREQIVERVERLKEGKRKVLQELRKVIIGQDTVVGELLMAFFGGGHLLITGVPGLAKTLMIQTMGEILHLSFRRIQFTPDLMPSDITGAEILEEDRIAGVRRMKFVEGPLFANIVLADEINRTPPKTQAALLEAMQEKQVTMGGRTYTLEEPFFVLATQIPFEQEGTYPLPEAQQDRFMFSVLMDYLDEDDEVAVIKTSTGHAQAELTPLLKSEDLLAYQDLILKVTVPPALVDYIVELVASSRPTNPGAADFVKEYIAWGAGLRASQYIALGAKSRAAVSARMTATPEDVRAVLAPVMRHRIGLSFRADVDRVTVEDIIRRLVQNMPVPAAAS